VNGAVREATVDELDRWDAVAVAGRGGHVLQSRAWAEHRRATGWRPLHLVAPDGAFVLALTRGWPMLPGGSAYIPRGPIPDVDDAEVLAERLETIGAHLAGRGLDVVASDAEVASAGGYGDAIRRRGFRSIEEIQPSRHRMAIPLGPGVDEATILAGIAKSTRARIRSAEASGVVVRAHDARSGPESAVAAPPALSAFYDLETATARRRGFALGPRELFLDWWVSAMRAGHLVLLEAVANDDPTTPIGGLLLYRHGGRLSTVQSADRHDLRTRHPGVLHLLRWRGIQLAIAEGCHEMDLGGTDVAGARHRPSPGEPMWGLFEHKASFGAQWIEQVGAHERTYRRSRYAAGRVAARLARLLGRRP
jgi:lipid II:glycine glycyltransferase (peptidoglycan interpeptide bridge formation enzyme)